MRPEGGIITGLLPTWTTTNIKGMFSLREAQQMLPLGQWPRGPIAPTNLAAQPQSGALSLTWTAPATTNGTITNYLVEYTPSGGATTAVLTGSTSPAYTLSGLTNNTAYTVRVAAVNFTAGLYASTTATPSGTISPNQIAGLQLWYDAADATTLYTATSGGSTPANDGEVRRIEDKSGNSRHATTSANVSQGSGRYKIASLNGKNTLDSPANTLFNIANGHQLRFLHESQGTVFCVYKNNTGGNISQSLLGAGSIDSFQIQGVGWAMQNDITYQSCNKTSCTTIDRNYILVAAKNLNTFGSRYFAQSSTNSFAVNTWHNLTISSDMTQANASNRGSIILANNNLALSESGSLAQGSYGAVAYYLFRAFTGSLAELIVYNSVLSSPNIDGIRSYLANKWGVT